ncbi:MAG: DUF4476 domain-containing protein [Ferruginibacter sp.]
MKRIFTLLILSILSLAVFAQPRKILNQGRLTISSVSNTVLRVMVDGNQYMLRNSDDEILLNNLAAGQHTVQVYKMRSRRANSSNGGWNNNSNAQLIYQANLYIKPRYHVDIMINRFGKALVDEQPVNWNDDYNNNDNQYPNNGGWNNNGGYGQTMDSRSFDQFKTMLRNERFDNSRLVLAKQTIGSNKFSAAQVKELMGFFSFDDSRLDLAKYAYRYTVDRNNYFTLYDAFSFSSSKEELARYTREYRD